MIKKINKNARKNIEEYVNAETGEMLIDELQGKSSLTITEGTNLITISSDEYLILDSKGLEYLEQNVNSIDFMRFIRMANQLKTESNVVYNHNIPHTSKTLTEFCKLSSHEFYTFIRRLTKTGVIAYAVGFNEGIKQKLYMINPTVARKRKTFKSDLVGKGNLFQDLSK